MSFNPIIELDDKAQALLVDLLGASGGTIVVDELPETGEEHTVYELQEPSKGAYNWVAYGDFDFNPFVIQGNLKLFVFDTYDQIVDTLEPITPEVLSDHYVVAYARLDDMLYQCTYEDGWVFTPYDRWSEYEHYVFAIPYGEFDEPQYILKSFDGYDKKGHRLGTLPDDTQVSMYGNAPGAFALRQATFDGVDTYTGISFGTLPSVSELPTVERGDITSGGTLNGSAVVNFNGTMKYSLAETDNYYYDYDEGYFKVPGEGEAEYTGELEWTEEMPDNVKEVFFEEYPYEDIINESLIKISDTLLFQPKKGGEIISTYWIYTNNEWVNIDEIGKQEAPIIFFTWNDYEKFTGVEDFDIISVDGEKLSGIEVMNLYDDTKSFIYYGEALKKATITLTLPNDTFYPNAQYFYSFDKAYHPTNVQFDETMTVGGFTSNSPVVIILKTRQTS